MAAAGAGAKPGQQTRETYFEVYSLRGSRWMAEDVCEEERDAMALASDLAKRRWVDGVRVVKEVFDQRTQTSLARVILEQLRAAAAAEEGLVRRDG